MNLSRRWLEALVGRSLDAGEVAALLTARCCPVEGVERLHADLDGVLVGRVLEVRRHPNADRLSLCLVDAGGAGGGGPLEVVCGAPNVTAGKTYPFAPVGTVLPDGTKLERRKIRGVESNGMLCSARELGLGQDADGILEIDTSAAPGTRLLEALPIADERIALEVYANRPDLLGHKGVARELAAALGATVKLPAFPGTDRPSALPPIRRSDRAGVVDGVEVRLEDPEGAPRYLIAVVRGVRVGPSPAWLADRLTAVGQRPINNIVDATNYILFELNQPMHAFDLARLRGPAIVVRRAKAGERMVTLDGVTRTLTPEMTAICDAERPTIVAGVMGSAESEVTATTTDLVLECAYFQPTRIRRTRRALALTSESSYRYERGVDIQALPDALRRALDLIQSVAGGSVREGPIDLWPSPEQPRAVFLRPDRVTRLLGVEFKRHDLERLLSSVGFVVAPKDERLGVQVPGWRPDVAREVDLIEEVARLSSYDAFPDELRPYRPGTVPDAVSEQVLTRLRAALAQAGLLECRSTPLGPADAPDAVPLRNPLSTEESHLRSRLIPQLVARVEYNWSVRERDVRLFEVGTVFHAADGGRPDEHLSVAGILTGARRPLHWTEAAKVPDMDIWDLKQHFELAASVAAPGARVVPGDSADVWRATAPDGRVVGRAGRLEADAPKWAGAVLGFEVEIDVRSERRLTFTPLPEQPAMVQDLSLVLPGGVTAEQVEAVLRREARPLLERVQVLDEYRGPNVPAGTRGVTWRCVFRDAARTLRDREVDDVIRRSLAALEGELGVRRRTG
ncbi:MAG TPA: phenylalanine--tRNA ligase subunit beta [Gemmatimonadales bacterium]|nr:phenylalanine--tRNA ligase subunit beta [Gemmatimonadales bacterium]